MYNNIIKVYNLQEDGCPAKLLFISKIKILFMKWAAQMSYRENKMLRENKMPLKHQQTPDGIDIIQFSLT